MPNKPYPPYPKLAKNPEPKSNIIPFPQKVPQQIDQVDKAEEEADLVLSRIDSFIQEMTLNGIGHETLIEGIFMRWMHVATLSADLPDDFLVVQLDQLGNLMMALFFKISKIEGDIPDDPEELLRILEEKATVFGRIYGIGNIPLRQRNLGLYAEFHNAFSDLLDKLSQEGIRDEVIEEMLLYCWVRSLAIMTEDREAFFGKIIRNWPEIFDGVSKYAADLMEIIYDAQEEMAKGSR